MSIERKRPLIHSLSNPQVKRVLRLRNASARRKAGRFLIDGIREIELAKSFGIEFETVFCTEASESLNLIGCERLQTVTDSVLRRISYGQLTDSPVAIGKTPELPLSRLQSVNDILLVLDRTEKPGNLGACFRTALAAGVQAVVLTDPICEVFNPNTIRSSRGAVFSLTIAVCSSRELLTFCEVNQLRIYCSRVDSTRNLWDCDFKGGGAVVFGNESQGLGENWPSGGTQSFCIPMQNAVDSLNLSISAAVTLYEAVRQRRNI